MVFINNGTQSYQNLRFDFHDMNYRRPLGKKCEPINVAAPSFFKPCPVFWSCLFPVTAPKPQRPAPVNNFVVPWLITKID